MTKIVTPDQWAAEQAWEKGWWDGLNGNFLCEEVKQITYAHRMGLVNAPIGEQWPIYDLAGKSVLDIGGGPVSMLLRCVNGSKLVVTDPCWYASWTRHRYAECGIRRYYVPGEDLTELRPIEGSFDECWIYNVLQHVRDPELIVRNALAMAPVLRIFEWLDIPACPGHPHELKAERLDAWVGGRGIVEHMNENGCRGRAWFGAFGPGTLKP